MKHLSSEQLVALAEDPSNERPPHLGSCERCSRELEALSLIVATMRRDRAPEPPAEAVERASELFQGRSRIRRVAEGLTRWVASLVMDSGSLAPAVAGVRGAAAGARQLHFTTERAELDLSHPLDRSPAPLRGQILPRSDASEDIGAFRPVTLVTVGAAEPPETLSTDALGCFRFAAVGPGRYELQIELEDGLVVASLELRPPEEAGA